MSDLTVLNPYGLAEGATCDNIRIQHIGRNGTKSWDGVVSLPTDVSEDLEGAATVAFLIAKKQGGLEAGMMAVCAFSYRDDEQDAWIYFL